MKFLLRTILVAAMPYLIQALLKRLNTPGGVSARPGRRAVTVEGERFN